MAGSRQMPGRKAKPDPRTIQVAGRELPLTIRESVSARRLTLRIEPGGRALRLTVPRGLTRREVDEFLERHHGWLMTQLARFSKTPRIEEGYSLPLYGVPHRIERTGKLRGLVEIVECEGEKVMRVPGEAAHMARRIRDHLKREALAALGPRVTAHAEAIGRRPGTVSLKDTRSRWGSCSASGNLSFSWRIVMAPPHVIDYLAAHEVAHLSEMNHSAAFWALCERLCPMTEEARRWLKRNGSMLHAYDFS